MILYRPVGLQELELIYDSGMKAFPARLPQQPIYYPVLQLEYARKTASRWNSKSGQRAGYVTEFKVEDEYIRRFETRTVGKSQYQELWIPAEEIDEFNKHIVGHIKVVEAHFGEAFEGFVPEQHGLKGKDAVEQFTWLANTYVYKRMDFYLEIKRNHKAVFLNYPFWQKHEFKNPGLKEKIIKAIREAWLTSFPKIPLVNPPPAVVTPEEQTDTPVQSSVTPVQKNITPVKKTEAPAQHLVKPVREHPPSVKQSDSRSSVHPVHKEFTPLKPTVSKSSVDDFDDDEDVTSVEQTDAEEQDFGDLLDEETTPDSPFPVNPVHEEITPVKQTDAPAPRFVNPPQEEAKDGTQGASHFVQGIKLGLSGEYPEAIDELSSAVEQDPDDVVAQTSLGVAFHQVAEDDRALACYQTALKIDPIYAEAHYFRANILYQRGNVREAIASYTVAIGLQPELIEAHQNPAPADRLTDYSSSPAEMRWIAKPAHRILHLNKLLESNPRRANLFKERAAEYSRLRNYAQAVADYNSSLALQPNDANALHLRGVAYEQLGQADRALEDYQQAVAINPQLSNEYIHRGVTFGQMGNLHQSVAHLTEAIRLAPQNADAYFNRGTAYFQLGDLESAIQDFSHVIRLTPKDEAAYYWRGISHEASGRPREASADYRQFLELSRDENGRAEIEQRLSQWEEGDRNSPRERSAVPRDRQKTNQEPKRDPDLYDLILALGERALHSSWFGSDVDCYGERAKELYAWTEQNQLIDGRDLLQITAGIQQTMKGDFQAFDPEATSPWIYIRAWEGSGFYIETNDPQIERELKAHFPAVEEVEGASPPYQGLFIRI